MNTAHKLALFSIFVLGCAVELSTDLDLTSFNKTPDAVDVTGTSKNVVCDMTIPDGAGGGPGNQVIYAACSFASPTGQRQGCLATSSVGDVWSCPLTIPADSENNTWTLEYVFAQDDAGGKLFATGAELVADVPNVIPTQDEVDLAVTSTNADTEAPSIDSFVVSPTGISPGDTVTCDFTYSDAAPSSGLKHVGCTFLPGDGTNSVSCISDGETSCDIVISGTADAGVSYTEVNHFVRDVALNITVATSDPALTFSTGIGPGDIVDNGNITGVWAQTGEDKVTQDEVRESVGTPINSVFDRTQANLFGMKNEVVSFNVVLEADTTPATGVSVTISDLTGPGTITYDGSRSDLFDWTTTEIELFYVRYLQIEGISMVSYNDMTVNEQSGPDAMRSVGSTQMWADRPGADKFFPEIAVPLEKHPTFTVPVGNQQVWADIYIPDDAVAGTYTGAVTISEPGAADVVLPVELEVYDQTMSDTASVVPAFTYIEQNFVDWFHRGIANKFADDATSDALMDHYYRVLHRHRVDGSGGIDHSDPDNNRAARKARIIGTAFSAANGYDGPGVDTAPSTHVVGQYVVWWDNWCTDAGGSPCTDYTAATEPQISYWADNDKGGTNSWLTWMANNAPSTDYFLYLVDEPGSATLSTYDNWGLWNTNMDSFVSKPAQYYDDITNITLQGSPVEFIVDSGDITEFNINMPTLIAADRAIGYNARRPMTGSMAPEDEGASPRELMWAMYKLGLNKYFYWASNAWADEETGTPLRDVYENAWTFGIRVQDDCAGNCSVATGTDCAFDSECPGGETCTNYPTWDCTNSTLDDGVCQDGYCKDEQWGFKGSSSSNGDGLLLYPGTNTEFAANDYGLDGPIASLRLKHWRRGIQDLEYIAQADAIDSLATDAIVAAAVPLAWWEYNNLGGYGNQAASWSSDPDDWEEDTKGRMALLNIIEGGAGGAGGSGGAGGTGGTVGCGFTGADLSYTGQGGPYWANAVQQTAYDSTLTFDFFMRLNDGGGSHDSGMGVGSFAITTWDDAWGRVLFTGGVGTDITVKAYDQAANGGVGDFDCDSTCPVVQTGVWHKFRIAADIVAGTYTVSLEEDCAGGFVAFATGHTFDSDAIPQDDAEWINVWDTTNLDTIDIRYTSPASWSGTDVTPPAGTLAVDATTNPPPGNCTGVTWSISPGGPYDQTGNYGPTPRANDTYTITWEDTAYQCTPPSTQQVVVNDNAQTLTLPVTNYVTRTSRSASVDIGLDDGGSPPLSGAPPGGGAWEATSNAPFVGEYTDSGTGDSALASTLYDGRLYTVTFTPESGYSTPPPDTFTAQVTPQIAEGDYVTSPPGNIVAAITKARSDVCAAPCGIHFDATGTTWTSHTEPQTFLDLDYTWDFDDPGCSEDGDGVFDASGRSCDEQAGTVAAHLFATAGTYTVTLTVTDPVSLDSDQETVQVVVSDPDVVWAGAKTHCISSDGTSATCPASGTTHLNTGDFITAINTYLPANGDVQILFERGDTFSTTGDIDFTPQHQKFLIGAYGTGANPQINIASGAELLGAGCNGAGADAVAPVDARFANLTLNGSGSHSFYGDRSDDANKQLTFYDLNFTGTWTGVNAGTGAISGWDSESEYCCNNGPTHADGCALNEQTFIVEVTFPDTSISRNLTWIPSRNGILGNTFKSSFNSHVVRMHGLQKNVFSRNHFTGTVGGSGVHSLKFHAIGTDDSAYSHVGLQTNTVIEGNLEESYGIGDPLSLGQQNGAPIDGCGCCEYNKYMQVLDNYAIDNNGQPQKFAEIHGDYAKAADNICQIDSLGGNTQFTCAVFDTRCDGSKGAPSFPIEGYHRSRRNHVYDSTTHSNYVRTTYFEQGLESEATDNVLYVPNGTGNIDSVVESGGPGSRCGSGLCTDNYDYCPSGCDGTTSPFGTPFGTCVEPSTRDDYEICRALP